MAIWFLSGDLSLVREAYLDDIFTGSLSIFVEDSRMILDVGDAKVLLVMLDGEFNFLLPSN